MRVLADRGRGSNGVMMMMQGCTPVMMRRCLCFGGLFGFTLLTTISVLSLTRENLDLEQYLAQILSPSSDSDKLGMAKGGHNQEYQPGSAEQYS